jgi:uncharacterized membrane protein
MPLPRRPDARRISRAVLAIVFIGAGILHFAIPGAYLRIMPPWLPAARALVLVSGACEIAGGLGLLIPRVRRLAALGLVALLVAVLPANVQMLLDANASHASLFWRAMLAVRLPLQVALMAWVWWAAGGRIGIGRPASAD